MTNRHSHQTHAVNDSDGDSDSDEDDDKYAEDGDTHSGSDTGDSSARSPVVSRSSDDSGSSSGDDESRFLQAMLRNQKNRVSCMDLLHVELDVERCVCLILDF